MSASISEPLSALPFRIETFFDDVLLSKATGFLYKTDNGNVFLVTNYHVLSGYNPETGQPMHSQGSLPNTIKAKIPFLKRESEKRIAVFYKQISRSLTDKEGISTWNKHATYGGEVDIGVLPLGNDKSNATWNMNEATKSEEFANFKLRPGLDVFILGFPLGISLDETALWKRGTIASEPSFNVNDKPMILVDTATREGMSGSPVISQINGVWNSLDKPLKAGEAISGDTIIGIGRRFIGVYSGRLGQGEFKAQLGTVWKGELITEIIDYGQPG